MLQNLVSGLKNSERKRKKTVLTTCQHKCRQLGSYRLAFLSHSPAIKENKEQGKQAEYNRVFFGFGDAAPLTTTRTEP